MDRWEQPIVSINSALGLEETLRELAASAEPESGDADLIDLKQRLALLHLMATAPTDDRPTYLWIRGHPAGAPCPAADRLARLYEEGWRDGLAIEIESPRNLPGLAASDRVLLVKGVHARWLALTEAGTHLFCPAHGNVVPVRVDIVDAWPFQVADPFAFGPVLRMYMTDENVIDLRTGIVAPIADSAAMRNDLGRVAAARG